MCALTQQEAPADQRDLACQCACASTFQISFEPQPSALLTCLGFLLSADAEGTFMTEPHRRRCSPRRMAMAGNARLARKEENKQISCSVLLSHGHRDELWMWLSSSRHSLSLFITYWLVCVWSACGTRRCLTRRPTSTQKSFKERPDMRRASGLTPRKSPRQQRWPTPLVVKVLICRDDSRLAATLLLLLTPFCHSRHFQINLAPQSSSLKRRKKRREGRNGCRAHSLLTFSSRD